MGKKYIIELEEPEIFDERKFYTCTQMPWWALSEDIVANLTPYTAPDLEQVRKDGYGEGFRDGQYAERNGLIANYAQVHKIKIGDEVERILNGEVDSKAVFLEDDEGYYRCLFWTGCCFTTLSYPKEQFRKTGRHFDEFATILEKMREESNG